MADHRYIEAADIKIPAILLTFLDQDTAEVNIDAAIDYAEDMVEGYIQGRYPLPLSSSLATSYLKGLVVNISLHKLYTLVQGFSPDDVRLEYLDAQTMLEKISAGTIKLGADTREEKAGSQSPVASFDRS